MSTDNQEAGANSPHLDRDEQDQAAAHTAPRALVIHEIVREEGEAALQRTVKALAWSGLAAGLSMGFSFLTQAMLQSGLPDTPWRHLVASFGYCMGFVIVIMGRQQLFTESTVTAILPVLTRRDAGTLIKVLRLWVVVLIANMVGAAIFAALLTPHGIFRDEVVRALAEIGKDALGTNFTATVLKAMFAGWLIALMVWLLPSARSARLATILLITYVVSLSRLSHIIAGSVEAFYAVFTGSATAGDFLFRFMIPTLIGNIIGGVSLVGMLNHAAIAPEINGEEAAQ